jgi:hypothetical protein
MATQIFASTATIPAGTPIAAPVTVDISIPQMYTEQIEWHMPKGAAGLVGWRLTSGGAQVLPAALGSWIITEAEKGSWLVTGLHDSGKWEVTGYNLGTFPHSVYVRLHASPIGPASRYPPNAVLPLYSLTSAADLTAAPARAFASKRRLAPQTIYQAPVV